MTAEIVQLSTVEFLTKRPAMMTAGGSLAEVLAFFDGFVAATHSGGPVRPAPTPSDALTWLAEQCGFSPAPGNISPRDRLDRVIRHFGDSEAALTALDAYATAFRESHSTPSVTP